MNGFFKTLAKPDWDDDPKRSEILNAANLLQIGEFQLIQLAYKVWYREDLPEDKIDKIFSEYMITGIIPIWVTYYAKDIIKLDKVNVLNGYDEKYHIYDHEFGTYIYNEKQRKSRGILYTTIIILIFIATHFMAINYSEEPAGFFHPILKNQLFIQSFIKIKNSI